MGDSRSVNRLDPATSVVDGRLSWLHLVTPLLLAVVFGGLGWFLHNHPAKAAAAPDHPAATVPAADSAAPAGTDQAEGKPGTDESSAEKPAEAPAKTKTHGHKPAKHKRHDK